MSNDKNIIFVTGYGYKLDREHNLLTKLGEAIAKQFPHPKMLSFDDEDNGIHNLFRGSLKTYMTCDENAYKRSTFFSDVLFNASLPSTETVVIVSLNMCVRRLIQYLALLDGIPKRVSFVVDSTFVLSKHMDVVDKYEGFTKAIPVSCTHFINTLKDNSSIPKLADDAGKHIQQIFNTSRNYLKINDIFRFVPQELKHDLFKYVFRKEEFAPVPFVNVRRSLTRDFDELVTATDKQENLFPPSAVPPPATPPKKEQPKKKIQTTLDGKVAKEEPKGPIIEIESDDDEPVAKPLPAKKKCFYKYQVKSEKHDVNMSPSSDEDIFSLLNF